MSQSSDSQPVGEAIALEDRSPPPAGSGSGLAAPGDSPSAPQPDGPDGPNSDPTISEAELDASMRTVLRFLRRRMRNARINAFIQEFEQQINSFSSNLPVWPFLKRRLRLLRTHRLAAIISFCAFIVVLVDLFLYQLPNLRALQTQNALLDAQTEAARWTAYQTWVMEVCPYEKTRNMTSPACEAAMAGPMAPPSKPGYIEDALKFSHAPGSQARLSNLVASWVAQFVNASALLEKDLLESDNHCFTKPRNTSSATSIPLRSCSDFGFDSALVNPLLPGRNDTGTGDEHAEFPLPSLQSLGRLSIWTSSMSPTTYSYVTMLTITAMWVGVWYLEWLALGFSLDSGSYIWSYLKMYIRLESTIMAVGLLFSFRTLAITTAKNLLLDRCAVDKGPAQASQCSTVSAFSSELAPRARIQAWSIWHAMFHQESVQESINDVILLLVLGCILFAVWITVPPVSTIRRWGVSGVRYLINWTRLARKRETKRSQTEEKKPLIDV